MQKPLDDRVTNAYNDFMFRLFGAIPTEPKVLKVDRERYTKVMRAVQDAYGLTQGDPDFLEWVLTVVGRSPILTSEGEIVYDTAHPASKDLTMGEAPPSETE